MNIHRVSSTFLHLHNRHNTHQWRIHVAGVKNHHTHVEILLYNKANHRAWKAVLPAKLLYGVKGQINVAAEADGTPRVMANHSNGVSRTKTRYGEFFFPVKIIPEENGTSKIERMVTVNLSSAQLRDLQDVLEWVTSYSSDGDLNDKAACIKSLLPSLE